MQTKSNGLAIASMVCGIVSVPLSCCYGAGLPVALAAVIMGFIARKQINESGGSQGGQGMALAGIITGFVSMVVGIIVLVGLLIVPALTLLGPGIGDIFSEINSSLGP